MSLGGMFAAAGNGMKFAAPIQMQQAETARMNQNNLEAQQAMQGRALAGQLIGGMASPPSGPAVPGMAPLPGQNPGGATPSAGAGAPSLPPTGGASAPSQGMPSSGISDPSGGFSAEKMLHAVSQSNAPDAIKFQALQQAMQVFNPYEKMQAQTMMRQMQIENQQSMLQQRLAELAREKDQWASVTQRGQDVRSSDNSANRTSRENIATQNIDSRSDINNNKIDARRDIAAGNNASREKIAAGRPGAQDTTYRSLEKQLINSRSLLTTMLNNGRGPGNKAYDEEKGTYTRLSQELENKRSQPAQATAKPALTAPDPQATTVEVISPDGTHGFIPAGQLNDAIAQGYKQK